MSTEEMLPLVGRRWRFLSAASMCFVLAGCSVVAGVWLGVLIFGAMGVLHLVVCSASTQSRISLVDGEIALVVPYLRWWRERRRVVLRPGEYGVVSHGVGWAIVDYDLINVRIFATGERLPLNSLYFRRREWLPVRDAIVANEKPPPAGRRHW